MMLRVVFVSLMLLSVSSLFSQQKDSLVIKKIYEEALTNGKCYSDLDYLSNQIGGRLSGSSQAEQAVKWAYELMQKYGFDSVWVQPVKVPHWVRGEKEQAYLTKGNEKFDLSICALGHSVGTGKKGLKAAVVEVHSFKELEELGRVRIEGKIVFFNRPMNPTFINTGNAYGDAVDQRGNGAVMAAKYGAVGVVVRSMTLAYDDYPHTGGMRYVDSIPKIPACAISTVGAEKLSRLLKIRSAGEVQFYFRQTCEMLPEAESFNVIAEIKGTEKPEEIILAGGHLDSWDICDGAHDDGTGVVQSIETLRLFKQLKLHPKRTLRCVLFMNEENGLRGGLKYAALAKANGEKNIAAIESDGGGFTPRAFGVDDSAAVIKLQPWVNMLKPYGIEQIRHGGHGSDIGPLKEQGTLLIDYVCDSQRYFDYHHSAADTFDKVNKRELELGAAGMCALMYLLSEYGTLTDK